MLTVDRMTPLERNEKPNRWSTDSACTFFDVHYNVQTSTERRTKWNDIFWELSTRENLEGMQLLL